MVAVPQRFERHSTFHHMGLVRNILRARGARSCLTESIVNQGCVRYGAYRGIPPVDIAVITGTEHIPPVVPVPDPSVSSVRHQYRYRTLRYVRYDVNTRTGHFGNCGTSMPVPDASISAVRYGYRYRRYRYKLSYQYRHFGKFVTTSIPVLDTSISSVRDNTGTGHFGKFSTTSTRYRHIVTSSLGDLAPRIYARKDTQHTPRSNTLAKIYRWYARYTAIPSTH